MLKEQQTVEALAKMMTERNHSSQSLVQQCELLAVNHSGLYHEPVQESEENLKVMRLLDEQCLKTPFYGVERLLTLQGWQTLYPRLAPPD